VQVLSTVTKQHDELSQLRQELAAAQNAAVLQQAAAAGDTAYQETKVLKDMQQRLAAHASEATAAWQAAETSRAEAAATRDQLAAATSAHAHERATLTTELAELRMKCQLRGNQAAEVQAAMQAKEQSAQFAEQQLVSAQAVAQQAEQQAAERALQIEQELQHVRGEAERFEQRAAEQAAEIASLQAQLQQHVSQVHLTLLPLRKRLSGPRFRYSRVIVCVKGVQKW
jgi:chromosome segregation ATPase